MACLPAACVPPPGLMLTRPLPAQAIRETTESPVIAAFDRCFGQRPHPACHFWHGAPPEGQRNNHRCVSHEVGGSSAR
eukprot:927398-Pyramimonas_sp.AAC.2